MRPKIPTHWTGALCMRTISSTARYCALGPQSPNYIEVPKPLQPTFPVKPIVKGHLPVPRDIFKTRNRWPKESQVFLDRSTREPKNLKSPGPYSREVELRSYKQRLAEKRRVALKEGVKQLHRRKVNSDAQFQSLIERVGSKRSQLALAPSRDVDVFTQTSMTKNVRDFLEGKLPSTSKSDILPTRRKAYARRMAKVQAVRASRLHDLYINAREFIVDEAQLDEAIEKAFGTDEVPVGWNTSGLMGPRNDITQGLSPWEGPIPEGVREMLQKLRGGEGVGLARERVRKIAEELTGGKM